MAFSLLCPVMSGRRCPMAFSQSARGWLGPGVTLVAHLLHHIEGHRNQEDGDEGGGQHPEDDGVTHDLTGDCTGPAGDGQRHAAENEGEGGHKYRPQAQFGPSRVASIRGLPFSYSILANSTMRMAFLAARPISMTRPIWA